MALVGACRKIVFLPSGLTGSVSARECSWYVCVWVSCVEKGKQRRDARFALIVQVFKGCSPCLQGTFSLFLVQARRVRLLGSLEQIKELLCVYVV